MLLVTLPEFCITLLQAKGAKENGRLMRKLNAKAVLPVVGSMPAEASQMENIPEILL